MAPPNVLNSFTDSVALLLPSKNLSDENKSWNKHGTRNSAAQLYKAFFTLVETLSASHEEQFYGIFVQEKCNLELFITSFCSINDLRVLFFDQIPSRLFDQGFENTDVKLSARLFCKLYLRNAAFILEQQLSAFHDDVFYLNLETYVTRSHSMIFKIGGSSRKADEEHINCSRTP